MSKKKKIDCVACGKEFEIERDELHEMGFAHPPMGGSAIQVSVVSVPVKLGVGGNSFWVTICPACGKNFCEASRDQVTLQALTDLLGWYVRQAIDLKTVVSKVRSDLS